MIVSDKTWSATTIPTSFCFKTFDTIGQASDFARLLFSFSSTHKFFNYDSPTSKISEVTHYKRPVEYLHVTPPVAIKIYFSQSSSSTTSAPSNQRAFSGTLTNNFSVDSFALQPKPTSNMVGPVRREDARQNGGNNRYNPFGITSSSFPQSANAPSTPAQPEEPKLWNWLNKAMPKNGMRFPDRASVCKRIRRDRSIWFSLDCEFLWVKPRDAVRAVTAMVNNAVFLASQNKPSAGYYEMVTTGAPTAAFEASLLFLKRLRLCVPFARQVSPPVFSEFFCEVIRARSAYFEHYNAHGWYIPPHEEHSPMALAVDKFLSVAWFWDDMEPIIAAEGAQECDEDNEEEKERISYAQPEDLDVTDKSDALGSLVSTFDGLNVWTLEENDNKYEDDVEPITDDEEDVVMGGM